LALAGLALVVLARPWVPTGWDEFVWLGKARFEAQGFGAGVSAALDPSLHVIPMGYPPLWPAAVGWLALGQDSLDAHVLAASLLVLLTAASAVEAWTTHLRRPDLVTAAALLTPLVWVHLRSTYVDLPVGLLGVALLGQLLRRGPVAVPMAVALVAFKDEGLAQVLAATLAVALVSRRDWRVALPGAVGLVTVITWRVLASRHGVEDADHALGAPYWPWVPTLIKLFALHAADVFSWGLFWVVALACASRLAPTNEPGRTARWLVLFNLLFAAGALLAGPERVRVFAENGTLINRLLMQAWPGAWLIIASRDAIATPPAS
jgi:hypothetical protein